MVSLMTFSITASSSTATSYYPSVTPICSSSEPPVFSTERSSLHDELIEEGIVDKNGVITEKAKSAWKPIPLSPVQIDRLRQLHTLCVYEGISLHDCLKFFNRMYGDALDDLHLIGGAAVWVLGWEYYLTVLQSLGIENPERFFPEEVRERFSRERSDYDLRVHTTTKFSMNYLQVGKDFENMLKGKLRKSVLDWTPYALFNNKENISLNLRLHIFEFVLYNKLKSMFLYGHRAIEIPCKAVLHGEESLPELFPVSNGVHLLQGLMDELLQRLNPYPDLNPQGDLRQAFAITEGYCIWEQALWEKISGRKFNLGKGETLGTHLQKMVEKINQGHPPLHPAGDYFNAMNVVSLFGENMTAGDSKEFWTTYEKGITLMSIHSSLAVLHPLWTTEQEGMQKLPRALLSLSGLLQQLFVFDSMVSSRTLYTTPDNKCCMLLQYGTLHLQMQVDLVQAYQQFVIMCLKAKDLNSVDKFLRNMRGEGPILIKEGWTAPRMNWKDLRQKVLQQRHQQAPAIRILNFYLLLALHMMEPLRGTENALLEMIPTIEIDKESLRILIAQCLNPGYADAYDRFLEIRKANPDQDIILAWLAALFQNMNGAKAAKLAQLLPRFQKHFSDPEYRDHLKTHLLLLREDYPEQAMSLLIHAMEGFKPLTLFCFELYFKILFPFLNPFYHNIIEGNIVELGLILERLCKDQIQWATHTAKREYVFLHIVGRLLAFDDNTLGKRIISAIHDGHPFQTIFGKYLPILRQMAFPVPISLPDENLPLEFQRMREAVTQTLRGRDIQRTKKPLVALFESSFGKNLIPHIGILLQQVWDKGKQALQSSIAGTLGILFDISCHKKIHEIFPQQCLEMHIDLIDHITRLPKPLYLGTNREYLLTSLQLFYNRVPLDRKVSYCRGIVHLVRQIWSPSEPIGFTIMQELSVHALDIIKVLIQSPDVCVAFLLQLHVLGISLRWDKLKLADFALLMDYGLRECSASEKIGILKIVEDYARRTTQKFPVSFTLTICRNALSLQSGEMAFEWYQRLLEVSTDPHILIDIIPLLLLKLHDTKKYSLIPPILEQYRKNNGSIENIQFLWTEPFVRSQANALLQTFMQWSEAGTFEDMNLLGVLCQSLDLSSRSNEELEYVLLVLLPARIQDSRFWKLVLEEINKRNDPSLKQLAFDILLMELEADVLAASGSGRFDCWETFVSDLSATCVSETTARKLIKDPSALQRNLVAMGTTSFRPIGVPVFRTLYTKFSDEMDDALCADLCAFHGTVCLTSEAEECSAFYRTLDVALARTIEGWITEQQYKQWCGDILRRLQVYPTSQTLAGTIKLLSNLSSLTLKNDNALEHQSQFINFVYNSFSNTPWIIRYLGEICVDQYSQHFTFVRPLIEDFFVKIEKQRQTTDPTYFDEHRKTIFVAMTNLVKAKAYYASVSGSLCDLVHHSAVQSFFQEEHATLVSTFIDCILSENSYTKDENPAVDLRLKEGLIRMIFQVFEKHTTNMRPTYWTRLREGTLNLIYDMVEAHENYVKGSSFFIKTIHLFSQQPFYTSVLNHLRTMFTRLWTVRPETSIYFAFELISVLIDLDGKNKGKKFDSIILMVDLFCFYYDYIGPSDDFERCFETYRQLSLKLIIQLQDVYAHKYHYVLPDHYSIHGAILPSSILMRYAQSGSVFCHAVLLDALQNQARYIWQEPQNALSIINALYKSRLQNPLQRHYGVYFIETVNEGIAKTIGALLKVADPALQNAATEITQKMNDTTGKFMDLLLRDPNFHYHDYVVMVRMLYVLTKNGAFDNDPDFYWLLAEKLLNVMNKYAQNTEVIHSRFILFGLMLLDEGIWANKPRLSPESEIRKELIRQHLIERQVSFITEPRTAEMMLQELMQNRWSIQLIDKSELNTLVAELRLIKNTLTPSRRTAQLPKGIKKGVKAADPSVLTGNFINDLLSRPGELRLLQLPNQAEKSNSGGVDKN
jgi:hypothetical protein